MYVLSAAILLGPIVGKRALLAQALLAQALLAQALLA